MLRPYYSSPSFPLPNFPRLLLAPRSTPHFHSKKGRPPRDSNYKGQNSIQDKTKAPISKLKKTTQ